MDIQTTYLAGYKPLVKQYTPDGVVPYPLTKKFTSIAVTTPATIDGMKQRLAANRRNAAHGNCLLRGNTTKELRAEPRAGAVNPLAANQVIILDIDNFRYPHIPESFTPMTMRRLARKITALLPEPLRSTSCLCSASSSMGTKPGLVSMHIEFWLTTPKEPRWHKDVLRWLNLTIPSMKDQLELSASGTAFRWKIDAAMASNAQIRYIAVPQFNGGVPNPIPDIEARHFMLRKRNMLVDPASLPVPDSIERLVQRALNDLRIGLGMPSKKESLAVIGTGRDSVAVVTNPDHIEMTYVKDNENFVYYNVNGGDSNGYYVKKYEPHIVRNFKGEPPFLFEAACPEMYQWHLQQYIFNEGTAEKKELLPPLPIVFRDAAVDSYYNGLIEVGTGRIRAMYPVSSLKAMSDFMVQRNALMPDVIPDYEYAFRPDEFFQFDPVLRRINKYTRPDVEIITTEAFPWGQASEWVAQHTPSIGLLLLHTLGNDTEAVDRFLNWLATIVQSKQKLTTAWIVQGCQGTGKGILFQKVISPILGTSYCKEVPIFLLEEQYNGFLEDTLLVMFDEFRLDASRAADKVYNQLKHMITEPVITIRNMWQRATQRQVFFNCMFASNDRDLIRVPKDDRRFNVAPRQEIPLKNIVDPTLLLEDIERELPAFTGGLLAMEPDRRTANTVLENAARRELQMLSETTVDGFCAALSDGDMDYFLSVLDMDQAMLQDPALGAARTVARKWLRDIRHAMFVEKSDPMFATVEEVRNLYTVLIAPIQSSKKFGRLLQMHGMATVRS